MAACRRLLQDPNPGGHETVGCPLVSACCLSQSR
jgi:hypothetical protein